MIKYQSILSQYVINRVNRQHKLHITNIRDQSTPIILSQKDFKLIPHHQTMWNLVNLAPQTFFTMKKK